MCVYGMLHVEPLKSVIVSYFVLLISFDLNILFDSQFFKNWAEKAAASIFRNGAGLEVFLASIYRNR